MCKLFFFFFNFHGLFRHFNNNISEIWSFCFLYSCKEWGLGKVFISVFLFFLLNVATAGLELLIFLPLPPECFYFKVVPPNYCFDSLMHRDIRRLWKKLSSRLITIVGDIIWVKFLG